MLSYIEIVLKEVFLFLFLGAAINGLRLVSIEKIQWFLKYVVVYVLFPLMIFRNVVVHLDASQINLLLIAALAAAALVFFSYFSSKILYRFTKQQVDSRSFTLGATFHNYGFTALPILASLLSPQYMPMAFAFVVSCDALFWGLGRFIMRSGGGGIAIKQIISPPFLGLLIGVVVVFTGRSSDIPTVILELLYWPAKITLPFAITSIGAIFYASLVKTQNSTSNLDSPTSPNNKEQKNRLLSIAYLITFRHLAVPIVCYFVTRAAIFSKPVADLIFIEAIMPASIGIVMLSSLYHGDSRFMAMYSGLSNMLSIVTIPFYLFLYL